MRYPIVLDLETKYSFKEYSDPKDLGITVVGIYDFASSSQIAFFENELPRLYPLLEKASMIIGFNIDSFDLPVLQSYYPANISQFKTLDILSDIKDKIGYRLALNDVAYATLGLKKTGHGLAAIKMYREKKFNELKKYCLDDVMLTKALFDYGIQKNEINYLTAMGKQKIKVDWKKYMEKQVSHDLSLTLPF